ncbi:uncharacterized protein LDX57_012705 [Aspergillus melleus]|uniref:uncharacterized protein n=1 Tax=Aspergillus melleus TaxID=138277 RepID=UPI001E8E06F9|nr:uncharacterized protein LDX57_012705 [Aspergillus melleus]KAH8435076.1 hypothetical protein LDX57_012705 [Aspergillus melleus]
MAQWDALVFRNATTLVLAAGIIVLFVIVGHAIFYNTAWALAPLRNLNSDSNTISDPQPPKQPPRLSILDLDVR